LNHDLQLIRGVGLEAAGEFEFVQLNVHDPELQDRLLDCRNRAPAAWPCALEQIFQIGLYDAPEFGQVRVCPLPMEERAAELFLQQLDRTGERGLRHVAALRGAREIQMLAHGKEVPDLVHFHRTLPVRLAFLPGSSVGQTGGVASIPPTHTRRNA
jgi:hypothetical protein